MSDGEHWGGSLPHAWAAGPLPMYTANLAPSLRAPCYQGHAERHAMALRAVPHGLESFRRVVLWHIRSHTFGVGNAGDDSSHPAASRRACCWPPWSVCHPGRQTAAGPLGILSRARHCPFGGAALVNRYAPIARSRHSPPGPAPPGASKAKPIRERQTIRRKV